MDGDGDHDRRERSVDDVVVHIGAEEKSLDIPLSLPAFVYGARCFPCVSLAP
jgi:hypothetical protein